ncbi:MAG TPA: histidine kinase, partial [Acidimicrobiales bacterium]|nr:histidine kinase [Acidimicrobiales bacterium]
LVVGTVIACFALAGAVASRPGTPTRVGTPALVLADVTAVAFLGASAIAASSGRLVLLSSTTLATARAAEAIGVTLVGPALLHNALSLGDPLLRRRRSARTAVAVAYVAGVTIGIVLWRLWPALSTRAWIVIVELIAAVAIALGMTIRQYEVARGDERRRMQWFGAAAVAQLLVLVVAIWLRVLFGWPDAALETLIVSSLPFAVAIVLAATTGSTERAEGVLAGLVRTAGMAVMVATVSVIVVVGYGPGLGPRDRQILILAFVAAGVSALLWRPASHIVGRFAERAVYGVRHSPSTVLRSFGSQLSRAIPLQDVLIQAAESLRLNLGLESAEIWAGRHGHLERAASIPDAGPAEMALAPEEAVVVGAAGVSGTAWVRVWLPSLVEGRPGSAVRVAPATHQGELLGLVVAVAPPGRDTFAPADESVLSELGRQIGLALHNLALDTALQASLDEVRRQAEELAASRARIVAASDAARRKIERDLHDGAQQHLVALAVNLRLAQRLASSDPETASELLDELGKGIEEAVKELRALAHGIYPPLLVDRGLREALESAAGRSPLPTIVDADGLGRYPAEVEAAVYFCCLEALQNAGKHAGAGASVTVGVADAGTDVVFEVSDNGAGFDADSVSWRGSGFVNMSDRVGAIGGTVEISSRPGAGTKVAGRVPISR